jgi:hypothetical protein
MDIWVAVTFNEAAHVVRTAVSARPHVDYFMIVDLGSRDDSDKLAALAFEVHKPELLKSNGQRSQRK